MSNHFYLERYLQILPTIPSLSILEESYNYKVYIAK